MRYGRACAFVPKNRRLLLALCAIVCAGCEHVTVVNMVPKSRSGETCQDSEPTLTMNPHDHDQLAASAFTWDNLCNAPGSPGVPATWFQLAMSGASAPIYVSLDRGEHWHLAKNVPSTVGARTPTGDITLHFSHTRAGSTDVLYTGILHAPDYSMYVLRTPNFRSNTPMTILDTRTNNVDQPHTQAATVPSGPDAGKDRVYVGFNNGYSGVNAQSASVDLSMDADSAAPGFTLVPIEKRSTGAAGQDGFAQVPAVNRDGTVYIAFYGWRGFSGGGVATDVVVLRDDNWGKGPTPFNALIDTDGLAGKRVVQNVTLTFGSVGQQRLGASNMAIAVDPDDSSRVYIAWGDQPSGTSNQTLHVRRSTDRGATWSADLLTVADAVSPALAINNHDRVGFLYQKVIGSGASQRWETHFARTKKHNHAQFDAPDLLLSTTPSSTPAIIFNPYLGDYEHVIAVEDDFYGVFTAANTPDNANFPHGVKYHRHADFATHLLFADAAHTQQVSPSIDPFFFHIEE
ncbi:MAG TPA: sialidase family protein [Candidatus Acidoferrum sp.]|nr:sialidase family protein [Candidatus Acidoferrum sp.]